MCGGYATDHPETTGDILFGAACALVVDNAVAAHLLALWKENLSALSAEPSAAITS